jgi:nitrite reductase/ring-hydroxylating ferredoxin subunit
MPDVVPTRLLARDLVAWRDDEGEAHVWEDLCIHRGARLSKGWIADNTVVCPYHGWRYDGSARCVLIPAAPGQSIPPKARAFPLRTRELDGLIWATLGEPAHEPQRGMLEVRHFGRIVGDTEIEIRLARHQQHPCLDRTERGGQIAALADVVGIPGLELRIEVGGRATGIALLPIGAEEGVEVWRAQGAEVQAGPVEVLAEGPAGIDAAEGADGGAGLGGEAGPSPRYSGAASRTAMSPVRNTRLWIAVRALPQQMMARATCRGKAEAQ